MSKDITILDNPIGGKDADAIKMAVPGQDLSKFTDEQRQVILERGKNLIVSAAAGSGKTTTMIARILSLIEQGESIDNLLVVTFTNASAADMKVKLADGLAKLEPTPHLLEQQDLIMNADVSTLHGFCSKLLKTYFYQAGIDPAFVILPEDVTNVLKQTALDQLMDEMYEGGNSEFFYLYDMLQKNRRDSSVKDAILQVYEFFNVILDKQKWFDECMANAYNPNFAKNRAAGIINGYVCSRIEQILADISGMIAKMDELKIAPLVEYLQNMQSELLKISAKKGFAFNCRVVADLPVFGKLPKVDGAMDQYASEVDAFKKRVNSEVKNFKNNFINQDPDVTAVQLLEAGKLAKALYNATNRFTQIYSELKKDKCGLDYNDLEHYTLQVLQNEDILFSLKAKYKHVFVDEYQDINAIQEEIISKIASPNNRFMVGDIKQSIYRFRLCDPDIFLAAYNKYKADGKNSLAIDLSKNFRSNPSVLDFVNRVFAGRMTKQFGGVDYAQDAQLLSGGDWQETDPVNICYIDDGELKEKTSAEPEVYSVKNHVQQEELDHLKGRAEAEYIASEIAYIIANSTIYDPKQKTYRGIKYSDIAILVPSRSEVPAITEVFNKHHLPLTTDVSLNVLEDEYVCALDNFLQLVVNKHQDICLFSVLYSPLFNFTLNELASIRKACANTKFFYQAISDDSLKTKLDEPILAKLDSFLQKLNQFKFVATYKTSKQLAEQIVQDFGIRQLMQTEGDGAGRLALLDRYIESLPEVSVWQYFSTSRAAVLATPQTRQDAISVVTIHKSKGLEYPVVFVSGCGREFNRQSLYGDVIINKELGIGVNYYNTLTRKKNNSLAKEAIKLTETRKMIEEQQRLLYVALTRAVNKLYVVACRNTEKLEADFPERPGCFADWLNSFVSSYLANGKVDGVNVQVYDAKTLLEQDQITQADPIMFAKPMPKYTKLLTDALGAQYSYSLASKTPQKTSVTQIASGYHESEEVYQRYNISASNLDSSSCDKGNAYHKLMQYIDFSIDTQQQVSEQIQKLILSGKLTQAQAQLIDCAAVAELLNNKEFKDVLLGGVVVREREFFMNTGNGQDVQIVQGVVDLAVIGKTSAVIIDYKTGNFAGRAALSKYSTQLKLYAQAISKCFNVKVEKIAICAIEQAKLYFID